MPEEVMTPRNTFDTEEDYMAQCFARELNEKVDPLIDEFNEHKWEFRVLSTNISQIEDRFTLFD